MLLPRRRRPLAQLGSTSACLQFCSRQADPAEARRHPSVADIQVPTVSAGDTRPEAALQFDSSQRLAGALIAVSTLPGLARPGSRRAFNRYAANMHYPALVSPPKAV